MKVQAQYLAMALHIQEAAGELSNSDICNRLRDAIADHFRGTGEWGYYLDHFGDDTSGDVVYSCSGDTCKAPYELSGGGETAAVCTIDFESALDVVPRTIYEPEADEADHYAAMEAALKAEGLYTALPLYERFVSKKERDSASSEDFAGKGKSFPILKPEDIAAAVHSMGRAGSGNLGPSGIKGRIIAIAKRKGWAKYLPKAWQSDTATEAQSGIPPSVVSRETDLTLVESAITLDRIVLRESRSDYEIKLIAPGKGSSAFYPAEVLKRDGPKVFTAGTHVYLNHPTAAEEAARPEGDVANLAGVLSTGAVYHESHAKGPGLYARMKVFADHAPMVEEKATSVGMSIRAYGNKESGTMRDGVPVLKELIAAESVDIVTRAGAGGQILIEAAPGAAQLENDVMDAAELKKLQESQIALEATNKRLLERAIRADARDACARVLDGLSLHEAAKKIVSAHVNAATAVIPMKDGELDVKAFEAMVNAEAQQVGEAFASVSQSGTVIGFGAGSGTTPQDPAKIAEAAANAKAERDRLFEADVQTFRDLGLTEAAAQNAAKRGLGEAA